MEITKTQLLDLINESFNHEMKEANIEKKRKIDIKNGKPVLIISEEGEPVKILDAHDLNVRLQQAKKEHGKEMGEQMVKDKLIGWNFEGKLWIQQCDSDINEYIARNPGVIEAVKEYYRESEPNLELVFRRNLKGCPTSWRSAPAQFQSIEDPTKRYISPDRSYKGPKSEETKYDATEWMLRHKPGDTSTLGLNDLVDQVLGEGNTMFSNHLRKLGIPVIKTKGYHSEKNKNFGPYRDGEVNNQEINYKTHNFNLYKTQDEYRQAAITRLKGNVDSIEKLESHLARQFVNSGGWDPTKKSMKKYKGKTAIYKLDVSGYEESNRDVTIESLLSIVGRRDGGNYVWTVTLVTKLGKKLTDEFAIQGGLGLDTDIQVSSEAQIDPPDKEFSNSEPILYYPTIYRSFRETLMKLQDAVMAIKPVSRLKTATPKLDKPEL